MQESTRAELTARLKEVLKEHQRDGLSMIGNGDKLVASLVEFIEEWIDEDQALERKIA
jgi:hypothetical protein